MTTLLANLDLAGNQILNGLVQLLASDPGSPVDGRVWVNTTSWLLKIRLNGVTIPLGRLDQLAAPTAAVAMNGQKITGLADPTAPQDAATQAWTLARSLSALAAPTADLAIGSHKLTGVTDPTSASDAATKNYVDNAVNGLDWKSPVRFKTTANVALASGGLAAGTVHDGVTAVTGDRALVASQTAGAENGIYVVPASGAASRAQDANSAAEVLELAVAVEEGTAAADTFWISTANGPVTLDTTPLPFAQFGAGATYSAGTGLALIGNVFSIENSGVLAVTHGGTGGSTASLAKAALGFMTRFAADIGNGALTSIPVVHNLGTLDVHVSVFRKSDNVEVLPDVVRTDTNTVTLTFAVAPTSNQYRAVVIG